MTSLVEIMRESPFDKHPYRYDQWYERDGRLLYFIELEALRKLGKSSYSLEVGVGTGRFSEPLDIEIGVDISFNMLKIGRERIFNSAQANAYSLPFRDSIFRMVYIIVTICFVEKPELVLNEASRVLNNKGRLVLGYIPKESIWGEHYIHLKKKGHLFYSHANFYTNEEILSLLQREKFKVIRILSTLFQHPDKVKIIEKPREGLYDEAGFIVIEAMKSENKVETRDL